MNKQYILGVIMLLTLTPSQVDAVIDQVGNSVSAISMSKDRMISGRAQMDDIQMCIDSSNKLKSFFKGLYNDTDNTTIRFDVFLDRLIGIEKGLADDPNDYGGLTKYGISQASYPEIDIAKLTPEEAGKIYYRDFYIPMAIKEIPDDRIAWTVFGFGVNAGPITSIIMLQETLNRISYNDIVVDGINGPITQAAIRKENQNELLYELVASRKDYRNAVIENDSSQNKFKESWLSRDLACLEEF